MVSLYNLTETPVMETTVDQTVSYVRYMNWIIELGAGKEHYHVVIQLHSAWIDLLLHTREIVPYLLAWLLRQVSKLSYRRSVSK